MTTTVEELAPNRVRLTVEVAGHDVQHAVEHAASDLAGSLKIPGFRKGKVPMPVLLSRVGRDRIYAEAVDSHIGGWFWSAAARERIHPVAQPVFDFDLPASDREDWSFTATVEVQPAPELVDWTQLEVPRAEVEVPEDLIEHELNALRASVADLAPVEDRPVQPDDTVVLDMVTTSGEAQRDYVVELGSGRLLEELEQGLVGMSAGDTRELRFARAEDETGTVEVTIKEIKEKVLPPVDDDLARAATEFETLAELRSDLEARLREQIEDEVEAAFRVAAVDELVEASGVTAAGPLVETRARDLLNGLVRSVESRGIPFETYLQLTGGNAEELVTRIRAEAAHSAARELALDALADRLEIEIPDEELRELVRGQAEDAGEEDPAAILEQVWAEGAHERLRDDLRMRRALDRLVADVKPISVELAAARDKLWTPGQEKTPSDTKLWTPGSKEPA